MTRKARAATTTEAELRALVTAGLTWVQASEKTGVNVRELRLVASVLGIKSAYASGTYGGRSAICADEAVRMLAKGATLQEVAAEFGVSKQAVSTKLKRHGLPTSCRAAVKYQAQQAAK